MYTYSRKKLSLDNLFLSYNEPISNLVEKINIDFEFQVTNINTL